MWTDRTKTALSCKRPLHLPNPFGVDISSSRGDFFQAALDLSVEKVKDVACVQTRLSGVWASNSRECNQ